MKEILIIADGALAQSFISRLYTARSNLQHYTIVTQDTKILETKNTSESFSFYEFDPTSYSKLKAVVDGYFSQFIVIMHDKDEALAVYENLRKISTKTEIVLLVLWDIPQILSDDKHLELVDTRSIISSHFVGHLPDMPAMADNIGLGEGEIMEVKVPVGSAYMYRHINSIQQKKWRIALIYRSNEIIIPKPGVMIRPNDSLIIVGDPIVLQSVFRSIKREPGQFPSPFGSNIYIFIDMRQMSEKRVKKLIDDGLFLNSHLKNKRLFFVVINPTFGQNLDTLKSFRDDKKINVVFDYFSYNNARIRSDIHSMDIGFIVCDKEYFFKFKELFYQLKRPVLKTADIAFKDIKQGIILSDGKENIENQSAVIMDFSAQLDMDIKLYYFDGKNSDTSTLAEHFESLNNLFEKSISIENSKDKNPILRLSNRQDMLQFIAFSDDIVKNDKFAFLSTNITKHYKKLSKNAQLFVPMGS
ncbi:COG3400 family protein [Campylobacter mucosalis]|uniref:COG3400 family protein n=1 Tax=Campylobacter mucosalis TaxID=202 RepID=UPI0004D951C7|nr:TrkA C-terminal domain-containing protein [Campylobacter mucosalis]KEA46546.1 potassium transporter TrkA [Campylobacter mucosalis]QKF62954.1 TrkA domain-containing protein [Campylobacter mucosalis]